MSDQYDQQTLSIIEGAVEYNKNRLGWRKYALYILFSWPGIIAVCVSVLSALVSQISGNASWLWLCIVSGLLAAGEHFLASQYAVKSLLRWYLPKIEDSYKRKIVKSLRKAEENYKEDIVLQVIEKNSLIQKAKKIIA